MRLLFLSALLVLTACDKPEPDDTGEPVPQYEDLDGDGFTSDVDCDDENIRINPGSDEECDGIDNDCDGFVDDEDPDVVDLPTWYVDGDGDGFGVQDDSSYAGCEGSSGMVDEGGDCDDENPDVNPDAEELCDGIDNDCNDVVDDAADAETFYEDTDGDGWGVEDSTQNLCEAQDGWVAQAGDCDDNDDDIHPDADELCDGIDNNCDELVDGADAVDETTWYIDNDADGYGHNGRTRDACEQPSGYVDQGGDCDDGLAAVNPGADEICDDMDNDCDGRIDADSVDGATWYRDSDGDGFGDAKTTQDSCVEPTGYVANALDCDDSARGVNPDAEERCDGKDNDCDGASDEDDASDAETWYADADGDGFGDASTTTIACDQPSGFVSLSTDCDDGDADVNPLATELCDDIDNDCDGDLDDDRTVTFFASSGTATDLSSTFRGSSSSSIISYTVSSSGTLNFCAGTYHTHLTLAGATVTVAGLDGATDTILAGGSSGVIIDAGSTTTDLTVEGLALLNGSGTTGGAIHGQATSLVLTLDECELSLNEATDGGAVWVDGATVSIDSCEFVDNIADDVGGAIVAYDSDLDIQESTFETNAAGQGGALWISGGSLVMDGTLVYDNTAHATASSSLDDDGSSGGGAFLTDGASLECSALPSASAGFLANGAFGEGGAVYQSTGCTVTSTLCDWGADGASDNNTPADIYVEGNGTRYAYDDGASFGCSDAGCS